MPLQSSGAISLQNLATEFGGSTPHSISEYYRSGGLVPNTGTNAGVPTSGTVSLSQFYSTSAVTNHTVGQSGTPYGSGQTGTPGGTVVVTTDPVTATVSNGVGPFTYSWGYISGDTFTVNAASSATTDFTKSAAAPGVDGTFNRFQGVYRCTVTDTGNSNYQASVDVTVTTDHYYIFA
jgi:hypothetical protein